MCSAIMGANDLPAQAQAYSGTCFPGSKKGDKNLLKFVFRYPFTVVADRQADMLVAFPVAREFDFRTFGLLQCIH